MEKLKRKKYYCVKCNKFFILVRKNSEQKSSKCKYCKTPTYVIRSDHGLTNYFIKKNGKRNK